MLWEMKRVLFPLAQKSRIHKIRKSKMQLFKIFRCWYLPGIIIRLRKTTSWDLDWTHQANTSFRSPVQTRKSRFSDFPFQGELTQKESSQRSLAWERLDPLQDKRT